MRSDVEHIIKPIADHFRGNSVTPQAVLWPNATDLMHRFHALTGDIDWTKYDTKNRLRLLDIGCGPGFLLDYLHSLNVLDRVEYCGVDLNSDVLAAARHRWPDHNFQLRDVRETPFPHRAFDVAIFCGVFTCRFTLDFDKMIRLMEETLLAVWPSVELHLAFNVMSTHVDWERDDLFHLPIDTAVAMSIRLFGTRNVKIAHDYGLFEYSCLVSRFPRRSQLRVPDNWTAI